MRSYIRILKTKSTINQEASGERFSSAFATEAEYLVYISNMAHPEMCCLLIGVAELAAMMRETPGTVAGYVTQFPERLPPRFRPPGGRGVHFRIKDHYFWSEKVAAGTPPAAPVPPPPPAPAAPEKRSPGRPRLSSVSVNAY